MDSVSGDVEVTAGGSANSQGGNVSLAGGASQTGGDGGGISITSGESAQGTSGDGGVISSDGTTSGSISFESGVASAESGSLTINQGSNLGDKTPVAGLLVVGNAHETAGSLYFATGSARQ